MEKYSVTFSFEVPDSTIPLNAVLTIVDSSTISLSAGQIQIQPYNSSEYTPPLKYLNVKEKSINLLAGPNPSGDTQGVKVMVPVIPGGASMKVNFTYSDVTVIGYYSVSGGSSGQLNVGDTTISFSS
ncbi:hypothetical protein [Collimonas silvisoli]|uniref:hypothetical protein n=1 Tax=Collimonas silvisoli TaxID=2825884 RepID=UPI001B8D1433|nr:hypothetical protein [Collimonas silvisoli]